MLEKFKTIVHSLKLLGPSQKNSSAPGVPSWLRAYFNLLWFLNYKYIMINTNAVDFSEFMRQKESTHNSLIYVWLVCFVISNSRSKSHGCDSSTQSTRKILTHYAQLNHVHSGS